MPIDIERARRDTPAASQILHFDNAGAALMPAPVLGAQLRHLRLEAETGGYEAAAAADERIEAIYDSIARLLNADRAEIALVENATVAWDMAFHSVGFASGDRILVAEAEYASNHIACLQVARRSGAVIDVVPSDAAGELDVEALERMIDSRVKLIAITHVPTNGGLVNPAEAIGRIAAPTASFTCSTPANPSASYRSTSPRSAATCCRPRAKISARAARDRLSLCAACHPRSA